MSSSSNSVHLENFYIFNSKFGPKEGEEHKKILFYHPPETDADLQIKNVGLSEAVVKFTQTFSPCKPCEAMHTQKTKQFFHQPEENFWMIMTIGIPFSVRNKSGGQQLAECHGEDVQDNVFLSVLSLSYFMFRFFQGSFRSILKKLDREKLKEKISTFFRRYLSNLKLEKADLLDVFNGVSFLPLDKNTFLQLHCFVNALEGRFPLVKYTAFLYNEQLVWSGLEQENMQILFKYLVTSLYPRCLESELQAGPLSPTRPNQPPFAQPHYGRFVSGPPNLKNPANLGKVPKVHVKGSRSSESDGGDDEECHLVVYRALSASVCLLIDSSCQLDFEFYKRLDSYLGPQLTSLASAIAEVYLKKPGSGASGEPQFKFIYFNHMNLAQKSTIHSGHNANVVTVIPEVMKLLTDINKDIARLDKEREVFMKSMTDCWVVGKFSDQRELYVFINQKNANLIEVNDELKKLCSTHFENIFYLD